MKRFLSSSMMCANFDSLKDEVKKLDKAGIDMFHCDVMDGVYVSNMGLSLYDIKSIRKNTEKPLDVHLMMVDPLEKIEWFIEAGADIIYIHPDSEKFTVKALQKIKAANLSPGIAINPGITLDSVKEILEFTDYVLIMTVNPGFAGQTYIDEIDNKIDEFIKVKDKYKIKIVVDGAISRERIIQLSSRGVDHFVLGTDRKSVV